jgi:hypothetical protein
MVFILKKYLHSSGGVQEISVINTGFGYQKAPIVTISGDGSGAQLKQ